MAEVLFDIYSGEFDAELKTLAVENPITAILGNLKDDKLGNLGQKLQEFMRLACPASNAVSAKEGAPGLSIRCNPLRGHGKTAQTSIGSFRPCCMI